MSQKSNALGALFIVLLLSGGFAASSTSTSTSDENTSGGGSSPPDECSDMIDNDGDGLTDSDDPECDPTNPLYDGTESGA